MCCRVLCILALLCALPALSPPGSSGQATPEATPTATAQSTALLVAVTHDPFWVTGSDGMAHVAYDLMLTNVFTGPVTLTAVDVLSPEGGVLLHLAGDSLLTVTSPLVAATPTVAIPASGAVATVVDVVVPPDEVPEKLTHRITYTLEPDAPAASLISSLVIDGPEAILAPFAPVVIAPPLRGSGWVNANGCCGPSAHRSNRLVVDGSHIVNVGMFATDWVRVEHGRLYTSDGTRNEDHFAFGADVLAVADGTVAFVRDGVADATPFQAPEMHAPIDYGGNQIMLEIAPGVYAFYGHLQPGSLRVQAGDEVKAGDVLAQLGNTGNSTVPHLHFELSAGPDVFTVPSLPYVLDRWTLEGALSPESTETDAKITGAAGEQVATLPLEMTVATFP